MNVSVSPVETEAPALMSSTRTAAGALLDSQVFVSLTVTSTNLHVICECGYLKVIFAKEAIFLFMQHYQADFYSAGPEPGISYS